MAAAHVLVDELSGNSPQRRPLQESAIMPAAAAVESKQQSHDVMTQLTDVFKVVEGVDRLLAGNNDPHARNVRDTLVMRMLGQIASTK